MILWILVIVTLKRPSRCLVGRSHAVGVAVASSQLQHLEESIQPLVVTSTGRLEKTFGTDQSSIRLPVGIGYRIGTQESIRGDSEGEKPTFMTEFADPGQCEIV